MLKHSIIREENQNYYIGEMPELKNSSIIFHGKNNYLICHGKVHFENSKIEFHGDNAVAFFDESRHVVKVNVGLFNNNVFHLGKNNYINDNLIVILSEGKHVFIGDNGAYSFGIWFRTADPHLIYDRHSNIRINPSRSIFVGDHVWIGQNALILKGTQIDSGSIIGGNSVISGKHIPNNSIYAGNPVRFIRDDIIWDDSCVHSWTTSQTEISNDFNSFMENSGKNIHPGEYDFFYNEDCEVGYDYLDRIFSSGETEDIIETLFGLSESDNHNRFVHK